MNTIAKILVVLCILVSVQTVQAQTKHELDKFLADCLKKTDVSTNKGCIECVHAAREKWELEVDKKYKEMMAASNDSEKQSFETMHNGWLKYKELHYKLLEDMYGGKQGTWAVILEEEKMKVVKQYALEIRDVLNSITLCRLDNAIK